MFQRFLAFFRQIGASMDEMIYSRETWLRTPFMKSPVDAEAEEIVLNVIEDE
jgi:hypothetical protein